jgi:hypothetical protein
MATEFVGATEGAHADQAAIYRVGNAVVVECRAIPTSASGTSLWRRLADMPEED